MGPEERQQLSRVRLREVDGDGDTPDLKQTWRETVCGEDIAPDQRPIHYTGLRRRRSGLAPELQSSVRSDEIVITAQELNVTTELVFASGMARRPPAQVRRALTNREVEALDERCVQSLGIL